MHAAVSKPLVFVVDDEPIIATTLAMIIEAQGLSAKSFGLATDALAAARLNAPDLLLSDVIMPQMTGVELATQLRAFLPNCKVVLLSGQPTSNEILDEARKQGQSFDVLGKPVHPLKVIEAIRRLLGNEQSF